jgi:hypothetical protein
MTARLGLMLEEDRPEFAWWDHEAAAVNQEYNDQVPVAVAAALGSQAERLAGAFQGLPSAAWDRVGRRGDGAEFSAVGLVRFALHESHHHLHDATLAASSGT